MTKEKDYRNTDYCPVLEKVSEKKQQLKKEIMEESPRTQIFYNRVRDRNSDFHRRFAAIFNDKCAYCGTKWGLLPKEYFEIDHFINESSFPRTTEGRAEAGKIENLEWSCVICNRGKSGITLVEPYDTVLNVENGNIANVFTRDEDFYIQIRDEFKNDSFINGFYDALHLNYEIRRLDYLILQLEGMKNAEKNPGKEQKMGAVLQELLQKRNRL